MDDSAQNKRQQGESLQRTFVGETAVVVIFYVGNPTKAIFVGVFGSG